MQAAPLTLTITDALGHSITVNTATGGGLPTKITDPNSVQTTLAYSPRIWLTERYRSPPPEP